MCRNPPLSLVSAYSLHKYTAVSPARIAVSQREAFFPKKNAGDPPAIEQSVMRVTKEPNPKH